MKYIVKASDGNEYGPVDQEVVVQWIHSGRVTRKTQVRNTLMKTWTDANEIPFISEAIDELSGAKVKAPDPEEEFTGPKRAINSLIETGTFKFRPANPVQRFLAWLVDMVLIGGFGGFLFMGCHALLINSDDSGLRSSLYVGGTVLFIFVFMVYYLIGLGFKAQTIGQWFWGIMIIGTDGDPVFLFRAFVYILAMVPLWPLTILSAAIPERRALQELLTGCRIVKITVRDR